MNIEKMREEFEAWSMKEYPGTLLARASTGGYRNLYVQMCWLGWKASRESLVIELPYVHGYPANEAASDQDYYIDQAKADMRHQCRKSIEAAGLKVKP